MITPLQKRAAWIRGEQNMRLQDRLKRICEEAYELYRDYAKRQITKSEYCQRGEALKAEAKAKGFKLLGYAPFFQGKNFMVIPVGEEEVRENAVAVAEQLDIFKDAVKDAVND